MESLDEDLSHDVKSKRILALSFWLFPSHHGASICPSCSSGG
jgi:hypothetical protein